MAHQNKKGIIIEKTLHLKHAFVSCMAYTSLKKPILTERVWNGYDGGGNLETGKLLNRRSTDNGRIWTTLGEVSYERKVGNRLFRRAPVYHLDPDNGMLVEFMNTSESWAGKDDVNMGPDAESDYLPFRTGRIFYRFSRDEGRTWGPEKQLIQKGKGYNSVHWAEGICYGKNAGYAMYPARLRDGTIIIPVPLTLVDKKGKMVKWPDRFGDVIWPVEACACFVGRWRKGLSDIDWKISNIVTIPEYMSRGLCEPAIAEVDGGKLMMVMRGSSGPLQTMSSVKFFSISKDNGKTWGPAVPLTYPDCSYVYSPGSFLNLFRSSKNGKVYLIANILPGPTKHCDPRYPLKIAEIDQKYLWVLPETETVIEDRQKRHGKLIRFSNWQRIEDRETKNPVIYMTEGRADAIIPDPEEAPVIPDSYRYEIKLP